MTKGKLGVVSALVLGADEGPELELPSIGSLEESILGMKSANQGCQDSYYRVCRCE